MPETLRRLVSRGPIDPAIAMDILMQLLKALEFDHWRGIIHGHIAPEDIVLTSTGQATRAAFSGVAVADDLAQTQPATAGDIQGYLAPEQISGSAADEQTDIFGLGVVAYEMLTGRHPFGASDGLPASSVNDRILYAAPLEIPQATLARLPGHIPAVLEAALAKDRKDRFADATSFLDALRGKTVPAEVVSEEPAVADAASPRISRSRWKWLIASVVGVVVVAALAVVLLVMLGEDSGAGDSTTTTLAGTTSTGQSVPAVVATTTSVAPSTTMTTIATTTTMASTTTTALPTRSEQTDPRLDYAGAWATRSDSPASGGSFQFANAAAASVTVAFEGTYLAWIARKSPVYGIAEVTLDGRNLGTIDLYSASSEWQRKVWGSGTLESGRHTVIIAWTGTKSTSATDTNINVDAFDIVGSLIEVPSP